MPITPLSLEEAFFILLTVANSVDIEEQMDDIDDSKIARSVSAAVDIDRSRDPLLANKIVAGELGFADASMATMNPPELSAEEYRTLQVFFEEFLSRKCYRYVQIIPENDCCQYINNHPDEMILFARFVRDVGTGKRMKLSSKLANFVNSPTETLYLKHKKQRKSSHLVSDLLDLIMRLS
jgi:hypothetical protein